jgi:hypothetical protein
MIHGLVTTCFQMPVGSGTENSSAQLSPVARDRRVEIVACHVRVTANHTALFNDRRDLDI